MLRLKPQIDMFKEKRVTVKDD